RGRRHRSQSLIVVRRGRAGPQMSVIGVAIFPEPPDGDPITTLVVVCATCWRAASSISMCSEPLAKDMRLTCHASVR
ncbi:hypothetical protein, partial [Roseiflexus castenholzii]|uniref:hypothetical protein n=1 Tax=Roseiflexus castenholzii TaxID=120962 RepID=UPI003C799C44